MSAGTIGLRASGKLSKDDYVQVLEPALEEGVQSGELRPPLRPRKLRRRRGGCGQRGQEDRPLGAWVRHHSAWKRFDVEWVAKAMHMFAWATPGEAMTTGFDELEDAKGWVAG